MENGPVLTGAQKAWATKRAKRAERNAPFKKEVAAKEKADQITRLRNLLDAWVNPAEEPPPTIPEIPACAHGVALSSDCEQCIAAVKPKRGGRRKAA